MIYLWYLEWQKQEKHIEVFPTFKLGEIKVIHIMLHYGLFTRKGNCYYSFTDVFDVFTFNRVIKLKMASKKSELLCNNWVTKLETWALVNIPRFAMLIITVCWGNWNVSPHAGTFHMTCTVIYYEISFKKMHLRW